MGMSSTGKLAYGYDLGGPESGWNFSGLEYGFWMPPGIEEEDEFDFGDWADAKLLASVGFEEVEWSEGRRERRLAAQARVGVEVVHAGNYDYFRSLLVTWSAGGYGSDPLTLDLAELERRRVEEDWDGKLANALKVLELPTVMEPSDDYKPTIEQQPHWMLTSFYG